MIKNRTAILALLTGLNLLNYIDRYVVAAVLKKMSGPVADGGLDLSGLEGGLLATAFLLGYFLTSPLFGARADKGKRTGLIAFGVVIWSVATFATGLTHSFGTMMIARICVGIGEASYATLAPTIIDDITPPDQKSRTLAIFYLAIPVGSALGYLLGGFVEARWGWRTAFFVAGGPGIVLALSCLLIVEPARKLREAKASIFESLGTLAKLPLFRRAVLGYCAYTAAISAFAYWAPKYLAERYAATGTFEMVGGVLHVVINKAGSLSNETADYYFGIVTVAAGAIGTIVGGRWADAAAKRGPLVTEDTAWDAKANKLGTNALLRVCAWGMVIAAPLTAVAFAMPTPLLFFTFAFFAEIGLFLSTSPVNAIGLRAVPPELRASAMAAMIFAIHLFGDLWSPTVLGLLNDVLISGVAMMAVPLVFAYSAYLWWPREKEAA
jgi:MFS transporter, Spinster family, sphingosine-1-phosphate transporter